jgi:hypothetical protein
MRTGDTKTARWLAKSGVCLSHISQYRACANAIADQGSWGLYSSKVPNGTTYADTIKFHKGGVLMSHRNNKLDLWNYQLKQQGLKAYDKQLYNPMRNNEVCALPIT